MLCVGVVLGAPGCRVVRFFFPSDEIELASPGEEVIQSPSSIDASSNRGLEIFLWVVDDTHWDAPRMLAPYLDPEAGKEPSPLGQAELLRWADWGFRLIAVPIEDVDGVLGGLNPVQPINVQWLGEFGQWRAIVRAGELGTNYVRVGQRAVEIERGRPRLIARSWLEPILTDTDVIPGVRLDLGMQIESTARRRGGEFLEVHRERMIEDDGPVLDELMFSGVLDGSFAIVIVGEDPDIDWDLLPERETETSLAGDPRSSAESDRLGADISGQDGFGPNESADRGVADPQAQGDQSSSVRGNRRASTGVSEPVKPLGKSLGELMLLSPGSRLVRVNETRVVPKRVVVVLIPRAEGGYTLLPRGSSGQSAGGD